MSKDSNSALSRREFIKGSVIGLATLPTLSYGSLVGKEKAGKNSNCAFQNTGSEGRSQRSFKTPRFFLC